MKIQAPDSQTQALLARLAEDGGAPVYELSPSEARAGEAVLEIGKLLRKACCVSP